MSVSTAGMMHPAGSAAARDEMIARQQQAMYLTRFGGPDIPRGSTASIEYQVHVRATALLDASTPGLPQLNAHGVLPAGIHDVTMGELRTRFATNSHRSMLLDALESSLEGLARGGVTDVVLGGSFLTAKELPGDIDLAYVDSPDADPLKLKYELYEADRHGTIYRGTQGIRALDIHRYDAVSADLTQPGRGPVSLLDLFSSTRAGVPTGMVRMRLSTPVAEYGEAAAKAAIRLLR